MALGRDYDWSGAIRDYERALSQYYRNIRPDKPDFLDYLLKVAPIAAMFVPGLSPMAKLGIAEGGNLFGSMKRGDPYQPDIMGMLQATMAPKIAQQQRIGDVLGAGEGVLHPEDINVFGQSHPEWIDWDRLAGMVSPETPSPFPAGPMSISKDVQEKLEPFFARSPENQMMRQLQIQRAMNLAYPTPTKKEPTETEKARQRKIKYLMTQGMSQQKAEDYLTQRGIYGKPKEEKAPKWLTEETKALFKGKGTRETETRSYEKKFQSAWATVLAKKDYLPEDKRKFWNSWRINVPKDLRVGVREALGIPEGITGAPKENQKQAYNKCRDAGGTHEECLRQVGVTINR